MRPWQKGEAGQRGRPGQVPASGGGSRGRGARGADFARGAGVRGGGGQRPRGPLPNLPSPWPGWRASRAPRPRPRGAAESAGDHSTGRPLAPADPGASSHAGWEYEPGPEPGFRPEPGTKLPALPGAFRPEPGTRIPGAFWPEPVIRVFWRGVVGELSCRRSTRVQACPGGRAARPPAA